MTRIPSLRTPDEHHRNKTLPRSASVGLRRETPTTVVRASVARYEHQILSRSPQARAAAKASARVVPLTDSSIATSDEFEEDAFFAPSSDNDDQDSNGPRAKTKNVTEDLELHTHGNLPRHAEIEDTGDEMEILSLPARPLGLRSPQNEDTLHSSATISTPSHRNTFFKTISQLLPLRPGDTQAIELP